MKKKEEVVTFKIDRDLLEMIRRIPNRSEFIRSAILSALGIICPLCNGTGLLTPKQRDHWRDFSNSHAIERCKECDELILVCGKSGDVSKDG
jgi:hypothetical protein